jgi:hypothetical protein
LRCHGPLRSDSNSLLRPETICTLPLQGLHHEKPGIGSLVQELFGREVEPSRIICTATQSFPVRIAPAHYWYIMPARLWHTSGVASSFLRTSTVRPHPLTIAASIWLSLTSANTSSISLLLLLCWVELLELIVCCATNLPLGELLLLAQSPIDRRGIRCCKLKYGAVSCALLPQAQLQVRDQHHR